MNQQTKYILHPQVRLKNDGRKCVLYTIDSYFHSVGNVRIITSHEAFLLSLFDGQNTFKEVVKLYTDLVGYDGSSVESPEQTPLKILKHLKKRIGDIEILVPSKSISSALCKEIIARDPPESFIIPADIEQSCPRNLRLSAPLSVNFNVATSCPFRCKYCYHPLDEIKDFLPIPRFRELVNELKQAGCESMMLTGGDPFQRPDFIEIVKILHEQGLFYSISTKSVLSRETISRLCREGGLDRIQLSLDSDCPETVASLMGCNTMYLRQFEQMVDDLHDFSVNVRIKTVLTRFNIDHLNTFLPYVHNRLGIRNIQVVAYGRSGSRHDDSLFPTSQQFIHARSVLEEFKYTHKTCIVQGEGFRIQYDKPIDARLYRANRFFEKRSICNAGRFCMTMMPNGKVTVCEQLPYNEKFILGDLSSCSLEEVWNGPKMKAWLSSPLRSQFPVGSPCHDCDETAYKTCHELYSRCLRFIWETTGSTDGPDIRCPKAFFPKRRVV